MKTLLCMPLNCVRVHLCSMSCSQVRLCHREQFELQSDMSTFATPALALCRVDAGRRRTLTGDCFHQTVTKKCAHSCKSCSSFCGASCTTSIHPIALKPSGNGASHAQDWAVKISIFLEPDCKYYGINIEKICKSMRITVLY